MSEKKQKKQEMRFKEAELSLMKNTFSENEVLLKIMRKVFLQLELSKPDKDIITNTFKGQRELLKLVRKNFLPEIDAEAPLGQVVDLWMTIDLKNKDPEAALWEFTARKKLIDLLEEAFLKLADVEYSPKFLFEGLNSIEGKTDFHALTDMLARNILVTHTEMMLQQLLTLSGQKSETPQATIERLQKDSTK